MESFVVTIPEAFAIVGSVATVVLGVFGYLLKTRNDSPKNKSAVTPTEFLEGQVQGAHDRISEVKDRVTAVESEIKLTAAKVESLRAAMRDHQERDNQDHELFDKKLDKMMDIVIRILTDPNL